MQHLHELVKEEASSPNLSPQSSPAMANREDSKSPVPKKFESFEEESKIFKQDLEGEPITYIFVPLEKYDSSVHRCSADQLFLTLYCIMSSNGQTHFKNLEAVAVRFLKCV